MKIRVLKSVISIFLVVFAMTAFPGCGGGNGEPEFYRENKKNEWGKPVYTPSHIVLELYQMHKDIRELFEKHGLEYWAEGGSLLGAVRHKGQTPWDDDEDWCMKPGHEAILLSDALQADLKKLNYWLKHHGNGTYSIKPEGREYPFIDLYIMIDLGDRYTYALDKIGTRHGQHKYILKSELYPIIDVEFGETKMKIPNRSKDFLDDYYGPDWNEMAYQSHMHEPPPDFKKCKFKLTDEYRKPAQPTGPLKDRTAGVI